MQPYDILIIGGGIVGLATARALALQEPRPRILVLEKERQLALHQTGRNSGVIHSGIYYKPGSLKAKLCRSGIEKLLDFSRRQGIPHEICGKIIVATREEEVLHLEELERRAEANGLRGVRRIDAAEIRRHEPHATGITALHVPETGIIDYRAVCEALAEELRDLGVRIHCASRVTGIRTAKGIKTLITRESRYHGRFLINCGGLHCDTLALLDGLKPPARILPFRGEYFALKPSAQGLVRNLIYPVPDPAFPFLGVHFTRMIGGGVECGPNAVLAFAREGYTKLAVNPRELWESLRYPGLRRLLVRHWPMALGEVHRSFSKRAFTRALQRLLPDIREEHLVPAPAGIRAQALTPDGKPVDDFLYVPGERSLHVLNAPSPAATASLAIGEAIAAEVGAMSGALPFAAP